MNNKTSILSNVLLWFGAAISIAEIFTGSLFAPLGFWRGLLAIIIGHTIGCCVLYLAGIIGAQRGLTAMESVRISFGGKGAMVFSLLNVLQLVGWTAVMIISGARAMGVVTGQGAVAELWWCAIIGAFIIIWVLIGIKNLGKVNIFAVGALFALTLALSFVVFRQGGGNVSHELLSFGAAVELSAAMPLSWLPLISDYTRHAEKPRAATAASTVAYFVGSCWMYAIGLAAALFTGESDIARIMATAGFGIAGVLIVLLSTVTTTFLDSYSAGVSLSAISSKINEKWAAVAVCVLGTLLAAFTPIEQYENFLYLIGSVFAPMVAILVTDVFILKKDHTAERFNLNNLILWAVGFVFYRCMMSVDTVLGQTLPVMLVISLLCILIERVKRKCWKQPSTK